MSWLGILLIGFAVTDLTHSVRRTKVLPGCVGGLVALSIGLLAGLGSGRDVVALLVIAAVVVLWDLTVTWGFGHPGPAWLPLTLFVVAVSAGVACSGTRRAAGSPEACTKRKTMTLTTATMTTL